MRDLLKEFGDLDNFIIRTNYPIEIEEGNCIVIINPDCELEWDCISKSFENTMYAFIVSLNILEVHRDFEGFVTANAVINEVKEEGY